NSLANFVTTAIMARALSLREFGVYSLLFAAMMTVNGLVNSVVAEPVRTLGVSRAAHLRPPYAGAVLFIVGVAATLASIALGFHPALGARPGAGAGLAVAAAILVGGLFEVMRALAASRLRWSTVLLGDVASQGLKLLLLGLLFVRSSLSITAAFSVLAAGAC